VSLTDDIEEQEETYSIRIKNKTGIGVIAEHEEEGEEEGIDQIPDRSEESGREKLNTVKSIFDGSNDPFIKRLRDMLYLLAKIL